jgi:hypothetical protein
MRFVESLALWLGQFQNSDERNLAYDFVMSSLIFCSTAELNHLVAMAYPDFIRPLLLERAAADLRLSATLRTRVASSLEFRVRQRQCLFLGLSDGARIDVFRRFNTVDLTHEQILPTYEISHARVPDLKAKLAADLCRLYDRPSVPEEALFSTVVLLDDFSGSGISYLRRNEAGQIDGKIGRFISHITNADDPASRLIRLDRLQVVVLLYLATTRALSYLESILEEILSPLHISWKTSAVHVLHEDVCLAAGRPSPIGPLLDRYYDPGVEDEHSKKGGTDLRYGFAGCGLPLVLTHNTPNNSLCLLWAQSTKVRALFPRVSRH